MCEITEGTRFTFPFFAAACLRDARFFLALLRGDWLVVFFEDFRAAAIGGKAIDSPSGGKKIDITDYSNIHPLGGFRKERRSSASPTHVLVTFPGH